MAFERDPLKAAFYNSRKWRRLRKAYAESRCYICENCKNRNVNPDFQPFYKQFHVHHKIEVTLENIDNPDITLNENNLMLLCQNCHNAITSQREVLAPGLEFDEEGMIREICPKEEKLSHKN